MWIFGICEGFAVFFTVEWAFFDFCATCMQHRAVLYLVIVLSSTALLLS
jgi:hypothetical protein